MTARDVYDSLKQEYPRLSNPKIEAKLGMGKSSMSRLRHNEGIGHDPARILSIKNPEKYGWLFAEADAALKACKKKPRKKVKKVIKKGNKEVVLRKLGLVNPGLLSRYAQGWCGYYGRG